MHGVGTAQGEKEFLLPLSPLISTQLECLLLTSSCSSGASWWDVHSVCMLDGEVLPAKTTQSSYEPAALLVGRTALPCLDSVCRAGGGGGLSLSSTKPDLLYPAVPSQLPVAAVLQSSLCPLGLQRAVSSEVNVYTTSPERCGQQAHQKIRCTVEGRSSCQGHTAAWEDVPVQAEDKQAGRSTQQINS